MKTESQPLSRAAWTIAIWSSSALTMSVSRCCWLVTKSPTFMSDSSWVPCAGLTGADYLPFIAVASRTARADPKRGDAIGPSPSRVGPARASARYHGVMSERPPEHRAAPAADETPAKAREDPDHLPAGKLSPELLARLTATDLPPEVRMGPRIGEDACAIEVEAGTLVAATDPITLTGSGVGAHAVVVNANDVAVTGARPRWFLACVLLPEGSTGRDTEELFAGMRRALDQVGASLVGGHTEVTGVVRQPLVVGQMLGMTEERTVPTGGLRPGDTLVQVGPAPVEGAAVLADILPSDRLAAVTPETLEAARSALETPGISVVEPALAAARAGASALHDPTEGGLSAGLTRWPRPPASRSPSTPNASPGSRPASRSAPPPDSTPGAPSRPAPFSQGSPRNASTPRSARSRARATPRRPSAGLAREPVSPSRTARPSPLRARRAEPPLSRERATSMAKPRRRQWMTGTPSAPAAVARARSRVAKVSPRRNAVSR